MSQFPDEQICLPACTSSFRSNSTCFLQRNIPLISNPFGELRAGHIAEEPLIADAEEKEFLFGEEGVYWIPSYNWTWKYGQITYGCDRE
jgi:hypothetical protein